jgi:hypothetical protein
MELIPSSAQTTIMDRVVELVVERH